MAGGVRVAAWSFIGVAALACSAPDMRDFAKAKPRTEDVVGTWRIDPDSAKSLLSRRGIDAERSIIELEAGGAFTWTGGPNSIVRGDRDPTQSRLVTWGGNWELVTAQNLWLVSMRTANPTHGYSAEGMLLGQQRPYVLVFDESPDGDSIAFVRGADTTDEERGVRPK
jgi:hypothetical protein